MEATLLLKQAIIQIYGFTISVVVLTSHPSNHVVYYYYFDLRIAVLFSASKPTTTLRSSDPEVISAQTRKVSRSLGLVVNG
jgi:hypothetical protein